MPLDKILKIWEEKQVWTKIYYPINVAFQIPGDKVGFSISGVGQLLAIWKKIKLDSNLIPYIINSKIMRNLIVKPQHKSYKY